MVERTYFDEAEHCRRSAMEVERAAEKAILLRLASEFDRLAQTDADVDDEWAEDPSYYAARAAQEISAAVKARHPQARLAHLVMAQRYDALAQSGATARADWGQAASDRPSAAN